MFNAEHGSKHDYFLFHFCSSHTLKFLWRKLCEKADNTTDCITLIYVEDSLVSQLLLLLSLTKT